MHRTAVLLLWPVLSSFHLQAQLALGTVVGRVSCADTNAPCRFASVVIQTAPPKGSSAQATAPDSRSYAASTDIEGLFQINHVAPGEYYIVGQMPGYVSPLDLAAGETSNHAAIPSQMLDIALTRITVSTAQTTQSNLTLYRGASVRGTVRYDDGSPAISVILNLLRKDAAGKLRLYRNSQASAASLLFESHTDDRGRYYEPALPPGVYSVQAALPQVLPLPNSITGKPGINVDLVMGNSLAVYYGDTLRMADARTIELHAGEDRDDVDLNIPTQGLHTVSGRLTAKSDGHTILEGKVNLLDPADKSLVRETLIRDDGAFVFKYVPPGTYLFETGSITEKLPGRAAINYDPFSTPLVVDFDLPSLSYSLTTTIK